MRMKPNAAKAALDRGETVCAVWAHMGSAAVCEALVWAGFPVVLLDNEHGAASLAKTLECLRAVEGAGGELVVRIPKNDHAYMKKILDMGVRSVMVPMVNTKADAEAAVAACLYPPQGTRGYATSILRASHYNALPDYGAEVNDEILIILQIEHKEAVANIDDIAAVPGVDVLFIGPNDLAGSIGKPGQLSDAEFLELLAEAERRILASGKHLGLINSAGRTAKGLSQAGASFIAGVSDVSLIRSGAQAECETLADFCPMVANFKSAD